MQWAFMHRAYLNDGWVQFSAIRNATGDSKDNVRRAANSLAKAGIGDVIADPADRRARFFKLSERGRRRTFHVTRVFEEELLDSIGAQEIFSKRVGLFNQHMWNASCYLASGDLADKNLKNSRKSNREEVPDDSVRFVGSSKRKPVLFKATPSETVPF